MHIKKNVVALISVLIFFGFIAVTVLNYFVSRDQTIDSIATKELPLTSNNIYSDVQRDLLLPKIVSSAMANDAFLKAWIANGEKDKAIIAKYLKDLANKYGAFTSFLVVDETLNFYYPQGFLKKLSKQEPRDEWFFRVRDMSTEFEMNIDPAEAHNDELTIFINVKVLNDDGQFIAAVGLGLTIDLLKTRLAEYRERYGNEVYFVTKEGQIILHSDDQFRQKNLKDFSYFSNIYKDILSLNSGEYRYFGDKGEVILQTRYVEDIDLLLAVEANVDDLTKEAFFNLLINIAIGLVVALLVLRLLLKMLNNYQAQLESLAWKDQLTGLLNREALVTEYVKIASQSKPPESAVIMLDLDHFKSVNDSLGHLTGDMLLKLVSNILKDHIRETDCLARWGGEEFVVFAKKADLAHGRQLAERLRVALQENEEIIELLGKPITASFGVSVCDFKEDLFINVDNADTQLYQAKKNGRNCVV